MDDIDIYNDMPEHDDPDICAHGNLADECETCQVEAEVEEAARGET